MFERGTARLRLRDLLDEDWALVYQLSQAPEVVRFQSWLRLDSVEAARRWISAARHHNQLQPRRAWNTAIVTLENGQSIGWLGWGRPDRLDMGDFNFGYALVPQAWGQGYMTEALLAALEFMFDELKARRVTGECAVSNNASRAVMARVGMRPLEHPADQTIPTAADDSEQQFAIDIQEWRRQSHRRTATQE